MKRLFTFALIVLGVSFSGSALLAQSYSSNNKCYTYRSASVLKACVTLNGRNSSFRVRKANGGTFVNSGWMEVRVGGSRSYNTRKGRAYYRRGSSFVDVPVDLSYFSSGSKSFYVTTSDFNYSVGPITVTATSSASRPATPFSAVRLSSPANASSITNTSLSFSWGRVSGASSYRIQIVQGTRFSASTDGKTCYNCVMRSNVTTSSTGHTFLCFTPGNTYSRRLRA